MLFWRNTLSAPVLNLSFAQKPTHPYMYTYRYKHICLSHAVESYSDVRPRSIAFCALRPAAVSVCAVKEPCLTAVKTTSLLCADINILIPFTGLERIAQQQDAQVWDLLKNNLLFSSNTTRKRHLQIGTYLNIHRASYKHHPQERQITNEIYVKLQVFFLVTMRLGRANYLHFLLFLPGRRHQSHICLFWKIEKITKKLNSN